MNLLIDIANYLEQQLKQKLMEQQHVATGDLLNSIKVEVKSTVDRWQIIGSNLHYGNIQDTGLRPGNYVPISALLDWIRAKKINLNGRRELDAAFAIQKSIFRKGTPTDGDRNKKRWISGTLEEEATTIQQMIQKALQQEIELMVENLVKRTTIIHSL